MKEFVKRMINEHAELVKRIKKLTNRVYDIESNVDDKIEFANQCIQLRAMRNYAEALEARLINQGIRFDGYTYLETVKTLDDEPEVPAHSDKGSDFDLDSKQDTIDFENVE